MLEEIAILFGGRIAEEVFMKQMSTGAANDFERATKLARDMVTKYGMSDKLGTMVYSDDTNDGFMAMSSKSISEATQQKVDAEIKHILDQQYSVARKLIEKDMIKNNEIDFIVNITEDKRAIADSYEIRRNALQNKVTYYTTLSGARAACIGMNFVDELQVVSIQSLHKGSS